MQYAILCYHSEDVVCSSAFFGLPTAVAATNATNSSPLLQRSTFQQSETTLHINGDRETFFIVFLFVQGLHLLFTQ